MIKYLFILFPVLCWGQTFAPEPGAVGSTAIHKDSSVFINWANGIDVTRGPMFFPNNANGFASYGFDFDALHIADGLEVVSLGDGGDATLTFSAPISNGPGPDFAVFENGFIDHYMELAFVEVSSDGINYTRFNSTSEVQTNVQLTNFDTVNCRYVNNFAGKYKANYGTPFDLEELALTPGLDVNSITHVKIIDVVGSIDPLYGTYDAHGTIINDTYPTMFESGGFDLDALGVIHSSELSIEENEIQVSIYPNPTNGIVYVKCDTKVKIRALDMEGRVLFVKENVKEIDLSLYDNGIYYLEIHSNNTKIVRRIVKF